MIGKMMVMIFGEDRAEYCSVQRKMKEKHFFETRNQSYMVMPNGLARVKIDNWGEDVTSAEIITYAEGETIPYIVKGGIEYNVDNILMTVDQHKLMASNWFGKKKITFLNSGGSLEFLKSPKSWLFIIMGIVLAPIVIPLAIDLISAFAGGLSV